MKRVIAVLTAAAIVFAGCSFVSTKTVLRIAVFSGSNWDVPEADSYELLDEAIVAFEKSHPDVEIEYISGIPKDSYEEWLSQQVLDDCQPDILFVPSELFVTLAEHRFLQPLNTFTEKETAFSKDLYYSASLQAGMLGEQLYALPYLSVPELMFVNKTILNEAGYDVPDEDWTWEDFYEIVKGVTGDTDGDGEYDTFGVCGYQWRQAAYTNDAQFYDEEADSVNLSSKQMIDTVSYLRRIYDICDQSDVTSAMFDEGQVAFEPMDYSDYRTYMPYPWRVK